MKKKYILFFLLIVVILSIFSSITFASSKEVFSGTIEEEGTAIIDGETYTAYQYSDYTGMRLSSNKYGSIIIEAEGDSATHGPYTYTLDSITEENNIASFKITVKKEAGEISLSRKASISTGTVGDQIKVTVTIANKGSNTETIKYAENLPREVSRVGTPEITKGTSTSSQKLAAADIYWDGILYEGESVTIVYNIMVENYPTDGTTIRLDGAAVTYKDSSGSYNESVDALTISLIDPVSVSFELTTDEADLNVNKEAEYTITITNNLLNTATISSFLLTLPSTVDASFIDTALIKSGNGYTWKGQLHPTEYQSFDIIVIPRGAGTHKLDATVEYSSTSGTGSSSATKNLNIEAGDVVPEIKLSSASFDGGEPIIIYYYVNNSDEDVSYSSVDIKITSDPSDLFDTVNYVTALPKKTKTLVKKQNFTAPYTDQAGSYKVTMTGKYGTSSFTASKTISINPSIVTVPYDLAYTIDGEDEENTNVTLAVTLLSTLTNKPSKISIIHVADPDYKKTVTLTSDDIAALFSGEAVTKSWSIPVLSFTGDSVDLAVELQYFAGDAVYEHYFTQAIPVYHVPVVEEAAPEENTTENIQGEENVTAETTEAGNVTLETSTTAAESKAEANATANAAEKTTVTITGQKEKSSKKWFWLLFIILSLGAAAFGGHYFLMKKQKGAAIKQAIESISSKEVKEEKKESFFARAKEIIIQEIPSPEDGYDKLEAYIKHALTQGKTGEDIKKILTGKGWIDDIVESYLRRLK